MKQKVYVFLADGFEEVEAIIPVDVLRRAGIEVITVSVTGRSQVMGAHKIIVHADQDFLESDFKDADMLVLPGGMPGSDNLFAHEGLKQILVNAAQRNTRMAAICAAPYIFGELGLLEGRRATCFPGFEKRLKDAVYVDDDVVVSDQYITAKGIGVATEFALTLVRELTDRQTADQLAARMVFPHV